MALRAYFTEVCAGLSASMIHDHKQLSISLAPDGSGVDPKTAVSLGLIITALVLNALTG